MRAVPPAKLPRVPRRVQAGLATALIALGLAVAVEGVAELRRAAVTAPSARAATGAAAPRDAPPGTPPGAPPAREAAAFPGNASAPSSQRVAARWHGRVVRAVGARTKVGDTCTLEAVLDPHAARPPEVAVACGGTLIWQAATNVPPGLSRSWEATENPGPRPGELAYALQWSERAIAGAAPGVTEIEIDTLQVAVRLGQRGPSDVDVAIILTDDLSDATQGPAFYPARAAETPAFRGSVVRRGRVRAVAGGAEKIGETCEVRVRPEFPDPERGNCRVLVRCESDRLYAGWARCEAPDGRLSRVTDDRFTPDDGDPKLALDWTRGALVLDDRDPAHTLHLEIELPPLP